MRAVVREADGAAARDHLADARCAPEASARSTRTRPPSPAHRRSGTSARAPPTTSTSSTPAAPPACPRAWCGATRTSSWRLGGGIDMRTGARVRSTRATSSARGQRRRPAACTARSLPLMHGAAQWSAMGGSFTGNTVRPVGPVRPGRRCGGSWAPRSVNLLMIIGDAMARPLDRGARPRPRRPYDLSSLVAVSSTAVLFSPVGEGPAPRAAAQPRRHRRHRLVGDGRHRRSPMVSKGGTMQGGPTVTHDPRCRGARRRRATRCQPGSGVIGRVARGGNIPLGYYKDEEKTAATFPVIDGVRYAVPGDLASVDADGSITRARPRVGVDQLRRREDLPRRGREGAQEPPRGVRRDRGRHPRRALRRSR